MASRSSSRRTAIIFLVLSVCFALAATVVIFLFFRSLDSRVVEQSLLRQQELVDIVVAARPLEQGTTLTPEHVEVRRVPRTFFLDTMVSAPDTITGRVPRERILAGEPLRTERLADPKAGAGLNALIPKGQRALQVELRGAAAVAGFISPGDYVDILFTGASTARTADYLDALTPGKHTKTLLQSKLVLAIDSLLATEDDGTETGRAAPSVTLALTPEEAQIVTHAMQSGVVTLTLRNHVDVTQQEVHGVSPDDFIGAANKRKRVADVARATPSPARPTAAPTTPPPDPNKTLLIEGASVRSVEESDDSER